jgi:Arm DNA-binding domain
MITKNFSASFFIKSYKINSEGQVTIFARILVNNIKTELSINRQIKPSQWNQKAQQIINHPDAEQENAYLQEFKNRIQNASINFL